MRVLRLDLRHGTVVFEGELSLSVLDAHLLHHVEGGHDHGMRHPTADRLLRLLPLQLDDPAHRPHAHSGSGCDLLQWVSGAFHDLDDVLVLVGQFGHVLSIIVHPYRTARWGWVRMSIEDRRRIAAPSQGGVLVRSLLWAV